MYKKGDFHIHLTASDGELKPGEILFLAKDRQVDILAITDHNTVSGVKQAVNTGEYIRGESYSGHRAIY